MSKEQTVNEWNRLASNLADATKECLAFMTKETLEKHSFWVRSVEAMLWFKNYLSVLHPPEQEIEGMRAVVKEKSTGKIIRVEDFKNGQKEKN